MTTVTTVLDRVGADRRAAAVWGVVLLVEGLLVAAYLQVAPGTVTDPWILVYPFVWINVGVWAIITTDPPAVSRRQWWIAAIIGVAYFVVLAVVGGLVNPGHALHGHAHASGVRVVIQAIPPGWSPALFYGGEYVTVGVFPFMAIGYVALSYLVYTTVLDAAGSAVAGVVGLFSCVSCTWPVLGTILTGVFGSSSAVVGFATSQPYGASTVVFLTAIALLYWRPLR